MALHFTSVCNTCDRECSENKEGGETDGPGSFETGHGQGNLSFNAIVLPDCNAVRYVLKGRGWFQKMTGRRSLCGGKGGLKVAIDFCIHPDLAVKKGAAYIFRKSWAWRSLKKIIQKQKNPKHFDDLNRAMRTGGQKLCANEMQNFALNHNKEIPKKNRVNFPWFYGCRKAILDPYPSVHFGVLTWSPFTNWEPWVF